ncbi:MAG: hypothetical protein ABJO36_07115 [Litorimonas sp.]
MSWPFERWQQIAICRFGLQSSEFWAMPLGHWLSLLNSMKSPGFDSKSLNDLIALYPDEGDQNEPGE